MRHFCVAVLLGLTVCSAVPGDAAAVQRALPPCGEPDSGTRTATIAVDGTERAYLIHAATPASSRRWPLIFAFHGRGETPEQLARYSGLSELRGIVVYPRGLPGKGGKLSWSGTPGGAPGVDDVRFVLALLGHLERTRCVDPQRVYATGKSDGGGLAAQLACKAADRIAAIAPVAGAYYPIAGGCRPVRAVSVLEIHGDADRVVPYAGSRKRGLPSIADWLAGWAARDACSNAVPAQSISRHVTRRRWTDCRGGTVVEAYRVAGGGHTWPGALAPSGPGATTQEIDASARISAFFQHHHRS